MCSPGVGEQLLISTSPAVAEALRAAAALPELPADVRAEALRHAEIGAVPWRLLHRTCRALRQAGPWLQTVARSGGLHLTAPQPRLRNAELERRAVKLRLQAEERAYQALVSDVTRLEKQELERVPVSGTMREVGFGVHVITVMATCFLAGLALGRRISDDRGVQCAVGAVGMLGALLVETALFFIKDHKSELRAERKKLCKRD